VCSFTPSRIGIMTSVLSYWRNESRGAAGATCAAAVCDAAARHAPTMSFDKRERMDVRCRMVEVEHDPARVVRIASSEKCTHKLRISYDLQLSRRVALSPNVNIGRASFKGSATKMRDMGLGLILR
jgi:ribosomal protein L2